VLSNRLIAFVFILCMCVRVCVYLHIFMYAYMCVYLLSTYTYTHTQLYYITNVYVRWDWSIWQHWLFYLKVKSACIESSPAYIHSCSLDMCWVECLLALVCHPKVISPETYNKLNSISTHGPHSTRHLSVSHPSSFLLFLLSILIPIMSASPLCCLCQFNRVLKDERFMLPPYWR